MAVYEIATGVPPFQADNVAALIRQILNSQAVPLAKRRQGLPRGLSAIVTRAMAKKPQDRFASMDLLVAELDHLASGFGAPTAIPESHSALAETFRAWQSRDRFLRLSWLVELWLRG